MLTHFNPFQTWRKRNYIQQILGLQPGRLPAAACLGKWTRGSGKVMRLISGKPALLSCLYSTIVTRCRVQCCIGGEADVRQIHRPVALSCYNTILLWYYPALLLGCPPLGSLHRELPRPGLWLLAACFSEPKTDRAKLLSLPTWNHPDNISILHSASLREAN